MHWSVFIKDNDMKTSSETDDDGPNCVSSSGLWLQKNFSTNLIWNFRLCFMVSLAQVLWQLKSMMFSLSTATEKSRLLSAERRWCNFCGRCIHHIWGGKISIFSEMTDSIISLKYPNNFNRIWTLHRLNTLRVLESTSVKHNDTSQDIKTFKLKHFCEAQDKKDRLGAKNLWF